MGKGLHVLIMSLIAYLRKPLTVNRNVGPSADDCRYIFHRLVSEHSTAIPKGKFLTK